MINIALLVNNEPIKYPNRPPRVENIVAIKNIAKAELWAQSLFNNDEKSKEKSKKVENDKDDVKDKDTSKKLIDNKPYKGILH